MLKLSFYGATETVTGSKYLLEADGAQVMIDCGMFQGLKELRLKNWEALPLDVAAVDALLLTHAHLDHCGWLPRLVRQGYRGPIHCTAPTSELTELILFDSAKNQEEDADYANRHEISKHKPALPLYDARDVTAALRKMNVVVRNEWLHAAGPIWARFHDAGHLLGSCMIEVEVRQGARPTRILFSGDVGRYGAPLYHDPQPPPACDYLICESTYGNRDHPPGKVLDQVCEMVLEGMRRGGVMVVPCFAVGRAQQFMFLLQALIAQDRIPELPIYLDSPMAVDATNIYCEFAADHDLTEFQLTGARPALHGRSVHLVRTTAESKRINSVAGPAIILSSSGMMIGGRILHHLKRRLPDPANTIVLGGFMAAGTRGRAMQDGAKSVRIHGQEIPVRAAVREVSGLSGHADRTELLRWLAPLPKPRHVFLTHGELEGSRALAEQLTAQRGWEVTIPKYASSCDLEPTS